MEFSTQSTASLHQIKTAALAVGVYADGELSPAADVIDRASNNAVRHVVKAEFRGRAGATLVLRALPGVSAQRVVLVGLGKQSEYNARAHAAAEQGFASACVAARIARSEEHTSELQSLMRISYAVFCLKKKTTNNKQTSHFVNIPDISTSILQ